MFDPGAFRESRRAGTSLGSELSVELIGAPEAFRGSVVRGVELDVESENDKDTC